MCQTTIVKCSIGRYVDRLFRRNKLLTLYNSEVVLPSSKCKLFVKDETLGLVMILAALAAIYIAMSISPSVSLLVNHEFQIVII